jgi:hypothetical protein
MGAREHGRMGAREHGRAGAWERGIASCSCSHSCSCSCSCSYSCSCSCSKRTTTAQRRFQLSASSCRRPAGSREPSVPISVHQRQKMLPFFTTKGTKGFPVTRASCPRSQGSHGHRGRASDSACGTLTAHAGRMPASQKNTGSPVSSASSAPSVVNSFICVDQFSSGFIRVHPWLNSFSSLPFRTTKGTGAAGVGCFGAASMIGWRA